MLLFFGVENTLTIDATLTARQSGIQLFGHLDKDRNRKSHVYNDLGDLDKDPDLARSVIDTKELPYPRRCKTGRPRCKLDPLSESRSSDVYVPRDEAFSEIKNLSFLFKTMYSVLHVVIPSLETTIIDKELGFPYFTAIDSLLNEGVNLPQLESKGFLGNVLPRLLKVIKDTQNNILLFETPEMIDKDKFGWMRDEEFCRQTLAGLNPLSIRLVTPSATNNYKKTVQPNWQHMY